MYGRAIIVACGRSRDGEMCRIDGDVPRTNAQTGEKKHRSWSHYRVEDAVSPMASHRMRRRFSSGTTKFVQVVVASVVHERRGVRQRCHQGGSRLERCAWLLDTRDKSKRRCEALERVIASTRAAGAPTVERHHGVGAENRHSPRTDHRSPARQPTLFENAEWASVAFVETDRF
jgi:hypothetical protein